MNIKVLCTAITYSLETTYLVLHCLRLEKCINISILCIALIYMCH